MLRLQLVLRGIERSQRQELTFNHLRLFRMLLGVPFTQSFNSNMIWAAMTLAFFGFLRLGELTFNSKFNPDIHLTRDCVNFSPLTSGTAAEYITVRIKESKAHPFCLGHKITIVASHTEVCQVQAFQNYISLRPTTIGPLFIFASGKPLTKLSLTFETRKLLNQAGFNASNYAGHSCRIGAATTAVSGVGPRTATNAISKRQHPPY